MFLKIATIIAIVGVALSLLLSFIQQVMFAARIYSDAFIMLTRLMSMMEIVLLHGGLLVFFVAFLLNQRAKPLSTP